MNGWAGRRANRTENPAGPRIGRDHTADRWFQRKPRALTVFQLLAVLVAFSGVAGGCAGGGSPQPGSRPDLTVILPGPHPPDVIPDTAPTLRRHRPDSGGQDTAQFPRGDCACTLEYRVNLCVTINGTDAFSHAYAGLSFARVREGGAADTLSAGDVTGGARCFGEWRGVQRVLMLRESVVVDSSAWFEIHTVDCCHGEAKTVDFGVK